MYSSKENLNLVGDLVIKCEDCNLELSMPVQ